MFVRKARRATPASLVVVALLVWEGSPAEARCGPPVVRVEPAQGPPGASVTVRGQRIYVRCNDVGPLPPGVPVMEPALEFQIVFVQGSARRVVTTVSDNKALDVSLTVSVPPDATLGPAIFTIEGRRIGDGESVRPAAFDVTK